jgi:drug/metabolite transporter (DMT)-like permease
MPALTLTAVQSGAMALGAMAISLVASKGTWHMPPATASFWSGMAYLVLLCTVFAFFAQNHAASRSSPSRVSLLMGSEPVFGALIAVYGFGERIGAWGWAGGLLIVLAAWWVTMPQSVAPRAHSVNL